MGAWWVCNHSQRLVEICHSKRGVDPCLPIQSQTVRTRLCVVGNILNGIRDLCGKNSLFQKRFWIPSESAKQIWTVQSLEVGLCLKVILFGECSILDQIIVYHHWRSWTDELFNSSSQAKSKRDSQIPQAYQLCFGNAGEVGEKK